MEPIGIQWDTTSERSDGAFENNNGDFPELDSIFHWESTEGW